MSATMHPAGSAAKHYATRHLRVRGQANCQPTCPEHLVSSPCTRLCSNENSWTMLPYRVACGKPDVFIPGIAVLTRHVHFWKLPMGNLPTVETAANQGQCAEWLHETY
jgi:hypothetical protein